jgi:hypothetical protein
MWVISHHCCPADFFFNLVVSAGCELWIFVISHPCWPEENWKKKFQKNKNVRHWKKMSRWCEKKNKACEDFIISEMRTSCVGYLGREEKIFFGKQGKGKKWKKWSMGQSLSTSVRTDVVSRRLVHCSWWNAVRVELFHTITFDMITVYW